MPKVPSSFLQEAFNEAEKSEMRSNMVVLLWIQMDL